MKKAAKFLVPLLLGLLILTSIVWYLFIYDRAFTRDSLLNQARYQDTHGNSRLSSWFYNAAYNFSGHDENVAIELANQYKHDGNYTKAELTLTEAIKNAPTVELYTALSRTYVEQDKLLDAVNLLEKVGHEQIKAKLDVQRPVAPMPDKAGGFYSQYIDVHLESAAKYIFYTTDGNYPSIEGPVYQGSISLPAGETVIHAIAVSEDGLVSPLSVLGYTVTGVIEEITIEDPAMDTAIRALIGADEDHQLKSDELWGIEEFTVPEDTTSYADLKVLPNLKKLTIQDKTIDTLSHLSSLAKLEELDLTGSRFPTDDMAVLASLPSLKKLNMSSCSLSTIEKLEGAKNLTCLNLSNNTLRNLEVLAPMTSLTELYLHNNAINALDMLSGLENLQKLDVSFNAITTLVPLANNVHMTHLEANNNQLINVVGLEQLSMLSHLSVDHNYISDISQLTANQELTNLSIASNDITDISTVGQLAKLEILDFSGNHVEYLPTWPEGCALQTIDGSYNALTSIDSLASLQALTHVYMDYNLLTNIDALESCFCLVQVNAFGNVIPDVSILRDHDIIVNYDPTAAINAEE